MVLRKPFQKVASLQKMRKGRHLLLSFLLFPLAVLAVAAIFAHFIAPYSPTESNLANALLPPAWVSGGTSAHLFGTDLFGRDIFSRLIYGARLSFSAAGLSILVSALLGTALGVIAGYRRGRVDSAIMMLTDITLSIPLIIIAIVLALVAGPSFRNVVLIVVVLLWPQFARVARGQTLEINVQDFIDAARVIGCSNTRVMIRHIVPNLRSSLLVLATVQIGYVILLESSLSFLGVGMPPPQPSWGFMVAEGMVLLRTAWWISIIPGITILIAVLSLTLLGDYLRDKLDPRLRHR